MLPEDACAAAQLLHSRTLQPAERKHEALVRRMMGR